MVESKYFCNGCRYCSIRSTINSSTGKVYTTWYCTKNVPHKELDGPSAIVTLTVTKPQWCPLKTSESLIYPSEKPTVLSDTYKPMNWYKSWDNIKPTTKWDDIKIGEVYHVPPIKEHERMDILITSKFASMVYYKILTKNGKVSPADKYVFHSMTSSSPIARRIVKHKLIDDSLIPRLV